MCRMILRLSISLLFFMFFQSVKVYAENIPVIVISAGKSQQSKSTVGSDVTIIN